MYQLIKRHLLIAAVFGIASNLLVLAPTIYLLQVYDRVLPSQSIETLLMLMAFMVIALGMNLGVDIARSRILSDLGLQIGNRLDRLALEAQIQHMRADCLRGQSQARAISIHCAHFWPGRA